LIVHIDHPADDSLQVAFAKYLSSFSTYSRASWDFTWE